MLTFLVVIAALVLAALAALLWYGIRTHKTVSQLESKVKASAGEIAAYAITKSTQAKDGASS